MIGAVTDGAAAAERQLSRLRHDPSAIALTLGAPVVIVVLFGYIFGSAISVPGGGNYREFLLPGLFAMVAVNILPSGFQFTTTWIGLYLGLVLGNEQAAGQASVLVFPVTMVSNVYVPTSGMPAWLRAIADWNPVSAIAAALRDLFGNPTAPANGAWPLLHPVLASVGWLAVLLVIFVPLCAARYDRA